MDKASLDDPYCFLSAEDLLFDLSELAPAIPRPRDTFGVGGPGLLRYPGGKGKLLGPILSRLETIFRELGPEAEYREPFLGAGAVGLAFLKNQPGRLAWLNDADPALATLWDEVIHRPDGLKMMVAVFADVLDSGYFYLYRAALRSIRSPIDLGCYDRSWVALAKLASHQMSFSGLGTCAGGPMGGRNQRNPEAVRSRYNPAGLCNKIDKVRAILAATRLREGTCTCLPFDRLFLPGEAAFYLDPPYYKAGPNLYQFSFGHEDHVRLASLLKQESRPWLLSYDDHPVIRELYQGWSRIEEVTAPYSINGCERKVELLISS